MKKIVQLFCIALLLAPLTLFAQDLDSDIREFAAFDKIAVSTNISVHLVPSNEEKAIIEAVDLENVKITQKGSTLKITTRKPILKGEGVRVKLFYKTIRSISAKAGSTITNKDKLTGDKIYVSLNAGGECILSVSANAIDVSAGEGSKVELQGKCDLLEVKATTGSKVLAKDLSSKTLFAKTSFGAHIYVTSNKEAELKALTGGEIEIYGTPKVFEYKTCTGGKVIDKTKSAKKASVKNVKEA